MKKEYIQPNISLKEMNIERAMAAGSDEILFINEDGLSGYGTLQETGAEKPAMGKKGIWQFFEE
ncbi:MAG: hypothetical protein IJ562_00710 [Prevotella sp.]|nr:hypothetical protein [Prevotella sp.]